ncbi:MAG: hypothetical protein ABI045_00910 [Flavobacteriales bacterium]
MRSSPLSIYSKTNPRSFTVRSTSLFTPNEKISHGATLFKLKKFGTEWAYTIDGGPIGELEFENFNTAHAQIHFQEKSIHPGYAKDWIINATQLSSDIY